MPAFSHGLLLGFATLYAYHFRFPFFPIKVDFKRTEQHADIAIVQQGCQSGAVITVVMSILLLLLLLQMSWITALPSHSCGGTLQNLDIKLLHSSMQTSADHRSRQRHVSHMTDERGETWSPSEMSKVRSRPESLWQTVQCTRCSNRKGAVAKGSPTGCSGLSCTSAELDHG